MERSGAPPIIDFININIEQNNVRLDDQPIVSPFSTDPAQEYSYLTYDSFVASSVPRSPNSLFGFGTALKDTKQIRSRQVVDIITLIAEISGVADILIVISSLLL